MCLFVFIARDCDSASGNFQCIYVVNPALYRGTRVKNINKDVDSVLTTCCTGVANGFALPDKHMGLLSLSPFGLRIQSFFSGSSSTKRQPLGGQDLFSTKLEGRLDNYKKGISAPEDTGVDVEISRRSAATSDALAQSDPKALQNYNSLLSGLTYTRSARVVANVEFAVRSLSNIPSEQEAKAQTDQILAAYNLPPLSNDKAQ